MTETSQRQFYRAPVRAPAFYIADYYVHVAWIWNISEGGVLLGELPTVPEISALPICFNITVYPNLMSMGPNRIKYLKKENLVSETIRAKCRIVRTFENMSSIDKVFVQNIGCEYVVADENSKKSISNYVEVFTRNTVFLLSLFEKSEDSNLIRMVSSYLGYPSSGPLSQLRSTILHDYQSLESR